MSADKCDTQSGQPDLDACCEELEKLRLHLLCRRRNYWSVALLLLIAGLLAAGYSHGWQFAALGAGLAALLVYYSQVTCQNQLRQEYKCKLVPPLLKSMAPELRYSPGGHISVEEFKRGYLFHNRPDRFKGEDLIEGKLGDTRLRMSELHAQERHVRHNGKTTTVSYETFFKGLYMIADFHKSFQGRTMVLPDQAEKLLGGLLGRTLQKWNFGREALVELEDPEFEREFVVYSTDQIESRYLLSTAMMRRILELKQRSGCMLLLAFSDNSVHLALHGRADMFEPRLSSSIRQSEEPRRLQAELRECLGIVEDLRLNRRIWSRG